MRLLLAILLPLLAAAPARASSPDSIRASFRSGEHTETRMLPHGAVEMRAVANGDVMASALALPADAEQRFIVQFDAPTVVETRRGRLDLTETREPYRRFLRDAAAVEAAVRTESGGGAATMRVLRRLETAFNGMAVSASRAHADRLRALPYVRAVYADDEVRTVLAHSVGQIGADRVRFDLGLDGTGVVVSIIDTGIDYAHPALGECFGSPCRVIDGYDFVNDDADPLDDHGHGTHVAGIVGASGTVTGVAPGVQFLVYKALGSSGTGLTSDVIAAIERSLDPDGNPLTDDAADVINLSLGGAGDADGPLAQAIDQAVAAGVVCVAAAGNAWNYLTIGSAGSARGAITVGAVDAADRMAGFSSRGPSVPDEAIKPDVVAPGVGIVSAWPGGGTRVSSGTSMAAPHVAGLAALLLEQDPRRSPATVKAVIMNAAVDLGLDPFTQGAGRVDAMAAAGSGLTIEPASLSFGLSSMSTDVWTATRTLEIRNDTPGAHVVTFSIASDLPPGSSMNVSPASITLAAGGSATVVASLTLDHAPGVRAAPYAYSGTVRADFSGSAVRIPFGVLRSPQMIVTVDAAGLVVVHDRSGTSHAFTATGPGSTPLFLPAGTYDAMAFLGFDGRAIREGIVVDSEHRVDLLRSGAFHTVRRATVDENGQPLSLPIGIESLLHRASGAGLVSFGGLPTTTRFTDVSSAYALEWHRLSYGQEPKTYDVQGIQRGVSSSTVTQNDPADFERMTVAYHPSPGVERLIPVRWVSNGPRGVAFANGFAVSLITNMAPRAPLEAPFTQEMLYTPANDPDLHYRSRVLAAHPYQGQPFPTGAPHIETPFLIAELGTPVRGYLYGDDTLPVTTVANGHLDVGFGPPTWFGRLRNSLTEMRMAPQVGARGWLFLDQQGGWRDHARLPFVLSREGVAIETGELTGRLDRALTPGHHTLAITDDRYWIDGTPGRATLTAHFNSSAADPDPPVIRDVQVLVNGRPSDFADDGEDCEVRVVVEDAVALGAVTISSRAADTAPWVPLATARSADRYAAAMPAVPGGSLALRIEASDATGNRLDYLIEPAIAFGGTAAPPPVAETITRRVGFDEDDGEERASGRVSTSSSDLELTEDRSAQTVGLRFRDVQIPVAATILGASVQFQADESQSERTDLTIHGERHPNPVPFGGRDDLSNRTKTSARTEWTDLPAWTRGDRGDAQRTPDLKAIIQEIVGQNGWQPGNALALIVTGSGKRVAESYDGEPDGAAELTIEYATTDGAPPSNRAPVVDAGHGRSVGGPPASIDLDGTVQDDGLPASGSLVTAWTASGPTGVDFDDPTAVDTRANFTAAGAYVLKLEASDGAESTSDTLTVHVVEPSGSVATLERRVVHDDDDAEEDPDGRVDTSSSDLELTEDGDPQIIGMRFRNITIPRGAVVTAAHLQFQADEDDDGPTTLAIVGEASDDAQAFSESRGDVSARARTQAVAWPDVPAWNDRGEQGARQRSPDLSSVIQAIVGRSGWQSGNALVLRVTGSGKRVAESHDGEPDGAALLHVEYTMQANALAHPVDPEPVAGLPIATRAIVAPNPMSGTGTLRLSLAQGGLVRLTVYDVQGRHVESPRTRQFGPGEHAIPLGGARWRPGLYFYRLQAPGASLSGRFMVLE